MKKITSLLPVVLILLAQLSFAQSNVGIGTTTPQAKLDVNGTFKLQNGVIVNGISADSTFTPGSDSLLPTQLAVKRYLKSGAFAPQEEEPDSMFVLRDEYSISGATCLFAEGDFLYTSYYYQNLFRIYDISNPDSIVLRGLTGTNIKSPETFIVRNNIAYVVNYTNTNAQLSLFDVSNPDTIVPLGHTGGNMSFPLALDVVNNIAYVTCGFTFSGKHLFTLDVSDPNNIIPLGESLESINGGAFEIRVYDGMAYVLSSGNRLNIFDVSDPSNIVPKGYTTEGLNNPYNLIVVGNYAYVTSQSNHKLVVFDISDPENIVSVGSVSDSLYYPTGLTLMENRLVVANGGNKRLCLFDITSNPAQPLLISYTNSYGASSGKFNAQGRFVYNRSYPSGFIALLEWTKPTAQKTLTLNPNGTMEFSSIWQKDDFNNIFRPNGNVGINTSHPEAALHVGGSVKIDAYNTLEFGANVDGKQQDAGKIGYNTFSGNALDIVGAGAGNSRKIKLYAEGGTTVEGPMSMIGNLFVNNGWVGINNYAPTVPLHLSGKMKIDSTWTLEFGAGMAGKQIDAGKIAYRKFSSDALDIIGAGTSAFNRKLKFYAEGGSTFTGGITVTTGGITVTGKTIVNDSVKVNAPARINGNLLVHNGWMGINKLAPTAPLHLAGIMKVDSTYTIEFGAGVPGKQYDAGKIGYQAFSTNALDIVGAGAPFQRRIKLWAEAGATIEGKLTATDSIIGTNAKLNNLNLTNNLSVSGTTSFQGNMTVQGNFGVGISNPTAKLHVGGNQKIEGNNSLEFGAGIPGKQEDAGKIGYTMYSNALDIIGAGAPDQRRIKLWAEAGTTVDGKLITTDSIRVAGSSLFQSNLIVNGNMGIQTSNPTYRLDVNGRMLLRHNGESSGIYFNKSNNTEAGFVGMQSDNKIGFYGNGGGDWNLVMNTTNGNVGIGTTNPTATLHVNGNQKFNDTNTIEFGSNVAGKNPDAGKIGYQTYTPDAMDIVGAGNTQGNRKVKMWDILQVDSIEVQSIASEEWETLDLWNNWQNYGNGFATAAVYLDPLGVMHFRGTISGGNTSSGTILFNLFEEYVPQYGKVMFLVPCGSGTARIEVLPNGNFVFYGSSNAWVSLDQISYRLY